MHALTSIVGKASCTTISPSTAMRCPAAAALPSLPVLRFAAGRLQTVRAANIPRFFDDDDDDNDDGDGINRARPAK
jgi:hypothetical protein